MSRRTWRETDQARVRLSTVLLLPGLLLAVSVMKSANAAPPAPKVDFNRDIRPILRASCVQCHGAERHEGGLRLDLRSEAFKGGLSGVALVPHNSAQGALLKRVRGEGGLPRMPLGFAPLTPAQIALLTRWIDQGADWPAGSEAKHWAYVRPVRTPPPAVKALAWCRNPIDRFVLARLERAGLRPAAEADRATLIRRVTLDLTGLPPSPDEVAAFVADRRPDAYARVVDRCLASPHFGERWARPWLDLARYADSNGYEKDARRSIWPYRDWVIDAYNRDMPYDEFTVEQLAGDMLPNATLSQRVATGFHRNTLYNEEGGVDREEQRWLTIVDRVGTTASVWLGTTLQCAECHNHKYDPFTNKEYYRFFAFFDHQDEPQIDVASPDQLARRKALQDQANDLDARIKALPPTAAPADKKALTDSRTALQAQLDALAIPTTLVMTERPGTETPTTYMHIKGGFLSRGELVSAGVPASLNPLPTGQPVNRLTLARWIASPENPLTARVAVNRLWEQLFGRGIVETSEDFGTQGTPPTHPELLDWLATEYIRLGWHTKPLLRLIVTSATYRQSSRVSPALQERDPQNRLLARGPRFRMEAEMIRDVALRAAGLLSDKIGGPSVFPVQPDGTWAVPYNGDVWKTSEGPDRYRRGIYTFWRRSAPYPSFVSFDATSREYCTLRRIRTTTPLQALTTLNDPAFFEAARGLARRMLREGGADTRAQLAYGFRCCVARAPKPAEAARLVALYNQQLANYRSDPKAAALLAGGPDSQPKLAEIAALTVVSNVLLNLDETLTLE